MILIVGCSKLGSNLAVRLAREGDAVTIVDPDRRNLEANLPRDFSGTVVEGPGTDAEVLIRAGIKRATAVVAVARDLSTNLMTADVARLVYQVPQVLVRIDDPRLADFYRAQGFEVISPILEGALSAERALLAP